MQRKAQRLWFGLPQRALRGSGRDGRGRLPVKKGSSQMACPRGGSCGRKWLPAAPAWCETLGAGGTLRPPQQPRRSLDPAACGTLDEGSLGLPRGVSGAHPTQAAERVLPEWARGVRDWCQPETAPAPVWAELPSGTQSLERAQSIAPKAVKGQVLLCSASLTRAGRDAPWPVGELCFADTPVVHP